MIRLSRQCERQIGQRPTLMYNAVTIFRIVLCPHNAADGSPYCDKHQVMTALDDDGNDALADAARRRRERRT